MAGSNRRVTLAAIALPFLFVAMSGLARANDIFVNTPDSGSQSAPLCTLEDAVAAANGHTMINGCGAGNGTDRIMFTVTGTILTDDTLLITDHSLLIIGPSIGCSGPGPCGITIDGVTTHRIFDVENSGYNDLFGVDTLTLTDGFAPGTSAGGGAIYANGNELQINDSLLVNNSSAGPTTPDFGGLGGAIFGKAGTIEIVNSTLANNTSVESSPEGSEGGAIFSIAATLKLTNTTISGNKEDFGAIVPGDHIAFLKGLIIANNDDSNCIVNTPTDLGFNIEDDTSCGFNPAISKNNTDPQVDPAGPRNNGGPTQTIALESGSPAIGFDTACTDQQATPQTIVTDQRLFARPDSPTKCDTGAYESDALAPITLVTNSERLQLVHSGASQSDAINTAFTFIDNGPGLMSPPACDAGNDALNFLEVQIFEGSCDDLPFTGFNANMSFVQHTVNHENYGTDFSTTAGPAGFTLSARMVQLPTPANACGEFTLNLELSALSLAKFDLTGSNPFALILTDGDGNQGCFDIANAIVGNLIPTPAHGVRRAVRRQVRR